MMAKFTLDIADDYPHFVCGINTSTSDYRLCWNINKLLGTSLKRMEPLSAFSKVNDGSRHSHFSFLDESLQISYHLIENKRGSSLFLPEVHQADYLFVVDGENGNEEQIEILNKLKRIQEIILVFRSTLTL